MTDLILIRVNCPDTETADAISEALISGQLAACTNLHGTVRSTYEWEGKVEHAEEWVLMIKAPATAWPAIEAEVIRLHPHQVPAILAIDIARAASAFAEWVLDNCAPATP